MAEVADIKGVGPVLASACVEAGFGSVEKIAGATSSELAAVRGVGEMRSKTLIRAAQLLLGGVVPSKPANPKDTKPKKENKKKNKIEKKGKKQKIKKGKKKKNKKKKK